MNDYKPKVPRALFAGCALALTAVTVGALVVAPAQFDSGFGPEWALAAKSPIEVAISPARIDVVGRPAPDVAWALPENLKPNCRPEG